MTPDYSNTIFKQAVAFVNQTDRHLFITGKAGTGKTTFLKYIRDNSYKRLAIVAPTGVAAINAGGVTIHSFFQLPFGPFLPKDGLSRGYYDGEVNTPASLVRNLRLPGNKRDVLRELDLLIIDEVSMMRADMLDAIDTVLRFVRRQPLQPFGGVQMVFIGDLFQLPPVAKNDEWELLKTYYQSPFFFDAQVIQYAAPLYIELKKIYRQSDDAFINLLNNIRNNTCTAADLEFLHQYYKPGYLPAKDEGYITLTSHNGKADLINQMELEQLGGGTQTYEAKITGEFGDRAYPAERMLTLKIGAQVMLIKNDKGEVRRFYNGKIGTISRLSTDNVFLRFANEPGELELERETWRNIRYDYNTSDERIEEEELGTFTQLPLRLAWAITIHKSQGLTFQKAIIDAGASFAPGQVYVSLSRLTGLDGLVLYSRILPHTISTNPRVVVYAKREQAEDQLQAELEQAQHTYVRQALRNGFSWIRLSETFNRFFEALQQRQLPDKPLCLAWATAVQQTLTAQQNVAENFARRLEQLFTTCEADHFKTLFERVQAAANYFTTEIDDKLLAPANLHKTSVSSGKKTKKYIRSLQELMAAFTRKQQQVNQALKLAEGLSTAVGTTELLQWIQAHATTVTVVAPSPAYEKVANTPPSVPKAAKPVKGESQRATLQLYKQGKTPADIAVERQLALGTIEGHLASFVSTGEIDVLDLVTNERLDTIIEMVNMLRAGEITAINLPFQPPTYTVLRDNLPPDFTFTEIRAALNFMEREQLAKAAV